MRYESIPLPKTKIIVPTLIIWGTNDGALEKKIAELSSSYCENCSIQYIEGASHWLQQEEPEKVNSSIRDFISNWKTWSPHCLVQQERSAGLSRLKKVKKNLFFHVAL